MSKVRPLADTAVRVRQSGFTRSSLHLIWTVPLALAIGYPLWFAARLGWCGFGGCWGTTANSQQLGFASGIALAIVCAGLIFAAVAAPSWVKPWWIRWVVALLLALIDAYIFGWGNAPSPVQFLPTIGRGGISF
jgi:hypothetical protein